VSVFNDARLDGLSFHSGLFTSLLHIEQLFGEAYGGLRKKTAVFDLDNTLLVGDVGDAVLAGLLNTGHPLRFTMAEYRQLVEIDPLSAYIEAARALSGFSLDYLIDTTKRALLSESDSIFCEGFEVAVPKPNLVMRAIVRLLREWDYTVFIISASNDVSAKVAGSLLFDIPVANIAGVKNQVVDGRLTDTVLRPVPVGEGKVARYRALAGDVMPMVVATDSELDMPMLQMCDPDGVAILVGASDNFYERAKQDFPLTVHLHRLPGDNLLFFQKHHRVA
jgi:phosphoserine phosphatase